MIHIYTGNGPGKTTAALGLAMRCLGHGNKVIVIQFMKGRENIGEYKIQKKLKNFLVYQFGKKEFVNLKKPSYEDRLLANKGIDFVLEAVNKKPTMIILDELCLAITCKLIDEDYAIKIIKKIPKKIDIVITGRNAPKKLIQLADFVCKSELEKEPKRIITKKGITY